MKLRCNVIASAAKQSLFSPEIASSLVLLARTALRELHVIVSQEERGNAGHVYFATFGVGNRSRFGACAFFHTITLREYSQINVPSCL
jgi:hypothetical protein